MPPASAPSPSGARRTPCWARRWGENVQWGMKAWSGNRRRGDLPMEKKMQKYKHKFSNNAYNCFGETDYIYLIWCILMWHLRLKQLIQETVWHWSCLSTLYHRVPQSMYICINIYQFWCLHEFVKQETNIVNTSYICSLVEQKDTKGCLSMKMLSYRYWKIPLFRWLEHPVNSLILADA